MILCVCLLAAPAGAKTFASKHYRLETVTVAKGLRSPWGLAFLPSGAMIVTERAGGIRIVSPGGQVSPRLAGMPAVYAHGQGGMLDVALDARLTNEVQFLYDQELQWEQNTISSI